MNDAYIENPMLRDDPYQTDSVVCYNCSQCGADICEGEEYFSVGEMGYEEIVCQNCIDGYVEQYRRTAGESPGFFAEDD